MRMALNHLRDNVVAYVALFVALGGTGYAALNLPAGSVGSSQLRNHVITPVKFDRRFINGTVRAWAEVNANGTVLSSSSKATVKLGVGAQGPGFYDLSWSSVAPPTNGGCFSLAGISGLSGVAGSIETSQGGTNVHNREVFVRTYGPTGQFEALPFYVALIC